MVLWWAARRIWTKLDALDAMLRTELRGMDVRITRIEAHLWPERPRIV